MPEQESQFSEDKARYVADKIKPIVDVLAEEERSVVKRDSKGGITEYYPHQQDEADKTREVIDKVVDSEATKYDQSS